MKKKRLKKERDSLQRENDRLRRVLKKQCGTIISDLEFDEHDGSPHMDSFGFQPIRENP